MRELVGTVGRPFGQAMEEAHYGQAEGVFENCQDCLAGVGLCRWEEEAEDAPSCQSAGCPSAEQQQSHM